MRVLGKPSHISSQNHIIIRAAFPPSIGSHVVTESKSPIGRVIDVFGPVDSPFVSIKPFGSISPSSILEQTLFIKEVFVKKSGKKRSVMRGVR